MPKPRVMWRLKSISAKTTALEPNSHQMPNSANAVGEPSPMMTPGSAIPLIRLMVLLFKASLTTIAPRC
jgi:hypothetical protein